MQIKTFSISAFDGLTEEDALNRFLRGHRILQIHRQLIADGANSHWAFCVEYMDALPVKTPDKGVGKTGRIDYKEVLDEKAFALFSRLREKRKALAEKDAVPIYAIFTNEQLAQMAQQPIARLSDLRKIDGVGEAKVAKYGESILGVLTQDETGGESTTENRGDS